MNPAFLKKIKRNDRLAHWGITIGGMAIIFCVILILVLIAEVSLPLFLAPQANKVAVVEKAKLDVSRSILAVGVDDYLESGYTIDATGEIRFFSLADGAELDRTPLQSVTGSRALLTVENFGRLNHVLHWQDGSLTVEQVHFRPEFDEADNNRRHIAHQVERRGDFPSPAEGRAQLTLARINEEGRQTRVDLLEDGRLLVSQHEISENFLGEQQISESGQFLDLDGAAPIKALALSNDGSKLYAGSERGELLRWNLEEIEAPELLDHLQAFADQRSITALSLVFGDVSLAVGDARGELSAWFPVRNDDGGRTLTLIHRLSRHSGPILDLSHSLRDKTVISRGEDGLHLDYMTSERFLLGLNPGEKINRYALSTRGDGLIALTGAGQLVSWKLQIPHPEISLKTLFGKVWYEGYDEPTYAWQSSAATDDYEPKLSLTPLIFGSLKGTFYAMLFAVPLAIFGAIYTSQFARPRLRGIIKPAVEVMAAVPTVIIGFLAALWLAPLIERSLGSLFLSLLLVPTGLMLSILLWQAARKIEPLKRIERGFEFIAIVPVLVGAVVIAALLGPGLEHWLFAGDLKQWLFNELGTRYDPRNCIIIAFAMGFAVVPIIFTMAEDSLSNVPPSLKAASLALGASRWQTVWRVILPSASPGIFAGTMIGFGRAVGETMIVLMATGNTAIMDLSIFNGMRPMSANIAVEIPEAPVDGSLYRTLFLSAVILFIMTFIVNTLAEIVRQRLRSKYGRF